MNTELFQKIHKQITEHPDTFNMESWENTACGTTRCIAGWAIYEALGRKPLFRHERDEHGYLALVGPTPELLALAREESAASGAYGDEIDYSGLGAALLGLDERVAGILFYAGPNRAARFVALAAEGKDEEAIDQLDRF